MTTLNARDPRIDFFRGLALIFIFWDHVPHNPLALMTVRNFGFSDATEIFVFLAGYAAILAYGRIAERDGILAASLKIWRRAWVLYVVHIFLAGLLMGLVFYANNQLETRDMAREMGLQYFLSNPQMALTDGLLLRFKPYLMDPLPLYIMLLAALPLVLPTLLSAPQYIVGLSIVFYVVARGLEWNLPNHDGGGWYFNPMAWQLLFILGGAAALYPKALRRPHKRLLQQPLFTIAVSYLLFAGLITLLGKWPAAQEAVMPVQVSEWQRAMSKTNLAPARLLHFLALAYVTALLLPGGNWINTWAAKHCCQMGRYSLEVFCLGVLLAPLADMLNSLAGDALAMRYLSAILGVVVMLGLAKWLELYGRWTRPVLIPKEL